MEEGADTRIRKARPFSTLIWFRRRVKQWCWSREMAVASLISAGFLGPGYYAPIASRMADALLRHWSAICNITENRVCGISAERRGGADMLRNVATPLTCLHCLCFGGHSSCIARGTGPDPNPGACLQSFAITAINIAFLSFFQPHCLLKQFLTD